MEIVTKSFKKALVINVVTSDYNEEYSPIYEDTFLERDIFKAIINRDDLKKIHICLYNRKVYYKELMYLDELARLFHMDHGIKLILHFDSLGIMDIKRMNHKYSRIKDMNTFMIYKDKCLLMNTNPHTLYSINKFGIAKVWGK